jgi:hypothetical protein
LRNCSEAAEAVDLAAAVPAFHKHIHKQRYVLGISSALTSLALRARIWHIPFCTIDLVQCGGNLRARRRDGISTTEEVK